MRRWIPVSLIVVAVLWFALTTIGAAIALSDIAKRPILAFTRGDQHIALQQPGLPASEDEAQLQGGTGIMFGYRFGYLLPSGETVICNIRFSSLSCYDGWMPERAP